MFGMRAFAYSLTAWAFEDHTQPPPSQRHLEESILQAVPEEEKEEVRRSHIEVWDQVCRNTEAALEREIAKSELPYTTAKEMRQAALRVLADGEDKKLALEILKGFETEFEERIDRPVWRAGYEIEYPE
jgi:hypothetical protein